MYVSVYDRVRKHVYMPKVFDSSDTPEVFQELAQVRTRDKNLHYNMKSSCASTY